MQRRDAHSRIGPISEDSRSRDDDLSIDTIAKVAPETLTAEFVPFAQESSSVLQPRKAARAAAQASRFGRGESTNRADNSDPLLEEADNQLVVLNRPGFRS
ncbi:hypothetical protein GCM10009655_23570 [Rhodoglobus aureus]|uniref:Uncharacterized protein n=1 Tax=Rhodoglobus aureus TaxID=191497 RepID=A0ABP4GFS6_9MICO